MAYLYNTLKATSDIAFEILQKNNSPLKDEGLVILRLEAWLRSNSEALDDYPELIELIGRVGENFNDYDKVLDTIEEMDPAFHDRLLEAPDILGDDQLLEIANTKGSLVRACALGRMFERNIIRILKLGSGPEFDNLMDLISNATSIDVDILKANWDIFENMSFRYGSSIDLAKGLKGESFIPDLTFIRWETDAEGAEYAAEYILFDCKLNSTSPKIDGQMGGIAQTKFWHGNHQPKLVRKGANTPDNILKEGISARSQFRNIANSAEGAVETVEPSMAMIKIEDGTNYLQVDGVVKFQEFGTPIENQTKH